MYDFPANNANTLSIEWRAVSSLFRFVNRKNRGGDHFSTIFSAKLDRIGCFSFCLMIKDRLLLWLLYYDDLVFVGMIVAILQLARSSVRKRDSHQCLTAWNAVAASNSRDALPSRILWRAFKIDSHQRLLLQSDIFFYIYLYTYLYFFIFIWFRKEIDYFISSPRPPSPLSLCDFGTGQSRP